MKQILFKILFVFLAFCGMLAGHTQIRTKIFSDKIPTEKIPSEKIKLLASKIPVKMIASPRGFTAIEKANETSNEFSMRYAVSKEVDLDFMSEAAKVENKNYTVYALTLHAVAAKNISLSFKEFSLSPNSLLSIYTDHELTDSITAKQNNKSKVWATRVYQGSKVTIFLKVPKEEKVSNNLRIGKINFGYKKFGNNEFAGNIGASAACEINVVCPAASGWDNERNSVALIVVDGDEACTGALVMNTCSTDRPFFLTANHCLGSSDVSGWVFQFQTWSAQCATNTGWREDVQYNGATLRANNAATDFALLELSQVPDISTGITYSGWDRTSTTPNGSVALHQCKNNRCEIMY